MSLGTRPAIKRGEIRHARTAAFEDRPRSALSLGWWLLVAAVLLTVLALVLVRGNEIAPHQRESDVAL